MRRRKRLALGALGLALAAAILLVPTIWFTPWRIDDYYARVFIEYALRHPMLLTGLGILDGTPVHFFAGDLDDFSVTFARREARFLDRQLRRVRRVEGGADAAHAAILHRTTVVFWFHHGHLDPVRGQGSSSPRSVITIITRRWGGKPVSGLGP